MKRWLNSEGINIKLEFEQMASELGIDSKGMEAKELAGAVYGKLKQIDKWLLVFDNADDYAAIKDYLPQEVKAGQHILITSRSQHWKNSIAVAEFSNQEVRQYISKELPQATEEQAQELVKVIGYLPLALGHATAYIKENAVSVTKYLELYKNKGLELLAITASGEEDTSYPHNVLTTWAVSMDKVKQQSPLAAKMLQICAYLSPDNIPLTLFEHQGLLKSITEVHKALKILRNYSLIEPAKVEGHVQIHRLVQAVVKHRYIKEEGKDKVEQQLVEMKEALADYYPNEKTCAADYDKARSLLPHMQAAIENLEPFHNIVIGKNNAGAIAQTYLLNIAGDIFDILGDIRATIQMWLSLLITWALGQDLILTWSHVITL